VLQKFAVMCEVAGEQRRAAGDVIRHRRLLGEQQRLHQRRGLRDLPRQLNELNLFLVDGLDERLRRPLTAGLVVQHRQIELAEPLRVGKDIDLCDLPTADGERHDRERLPVEHADQPRGAVDEHREPEQIEAREG